MENIDIINKIKSQRKGTYLTFIKNKDLGNGVSKQSKMNMRIGCNYSNLSLNKDRQTGELPWGNWVKGLENLVIEHKGNYYLRVTSKTPENPEGAGVLETKYFFNGLEISKQAALDIVGSRKFESRPSAVYNIKFENIISI